MNDTGIARQDRLRAWFQRLQVQDPKLHAELAQKVAALTSTEELMSGAPGIRTESVAPGGPGAFKAKAGLGVDAAAISLETIVRTGRPALFVKQGAISRESPLTDDVSKHMIDLIMDAAPTLDPKLSLIGRIDVANHPAGYRYVGTGWLGAKGILVTNRHVANLIGQRDGARYVFSRGMFNQPLDVSFNHRREVTDPDDTSTATEVQEILWIAPDGGPDVALLRIDAGTDAYLKLAASDGSENDYIATIGYPARAYSETIPDQRWMDAIYGGIYDIKRAAPGQLQKPQQDSSCYDCTTLGGASGSPVLDMATGSVVALHFAGLYEVENYGVPASRLRPLLEQRSWDVRTGDARAPETATLPAPASATVVAPATMTSVPASPAGGATTSLTIPVTISVQIGGAAVAAVAPVPADLPLADAVAALRGEKRAGVRTVKQGYRFTESGAEPCIVVSAEPSQLAAVQAALPPRYGGHAVEIRAAAIDTAPGQVQLSEAPARIVYDDRDGGDFDYDGKPATMRVVAHVGPEQSFPVLGPFLAGATKKLTSAMYQFYVEHIAAVIDKRLAAGVSMRLVADPQTHDPGNGTIKPGEFDRSDRFTAWRDAGHFENIYVPKGNGGLVANAYHIKVTVRDGKSFWLSSGNWTRASQPDPASGTGSGNREWHVVVENEALSRFFSAHIDADFKQCKDIGATAEAAALAPPMVDVPLETLIDTDFEAPVRKLDPKTFEGKIAVTPLLTPDRHGRAYTDAVLALIRSATDQLVFQNQYIKIATSPGGNLSELVDALVAKAKTIRDVRIILRSGDLLDDLDELQRRGLDVTRCVRILGNTHTKGIVVDGQRVLIGSQNWSESALSANRDASLLFAHPGIAGYFLEAFEIDWARARRPSQAAQSRPALHAEGAAPPPGYVRMSLADYLDG